MIGAWEKKNSSPFGGDNEPLEMSDISSWPLHFHENQFIFFRRAPLDPGCLEQFWNTPAVLERVFYILSALLAAQFVTTFIGCVSCTDGQWSPPLGPAH